MSIQAKSQTIQLADGKTITIETGKLAKQADGSVVVKQGGTMLLATVVSSTELRDGIDFFPLSVDYKEKYTAAGKFPGGYLKREARPSEINLITKPPQTKHGKRITLQLGWWLLAGWYTRLVRSARVMDIRQMGERLCRLRF